MVSVCFFVCLFLRGKGVKVIGQVHLGYFFSKCLCIEREGARKTIFAALSTVFELNEHQLRSERSFLGCRAEGSAAPQDAISGTVLGAESQMPVHWRLALGPRGFLDRNDG